MSTSTPISALFLFFLLISGSAAKTPGKRSRYHKPSKKLVVYFHDVLYNGKNANRTTLVGDNHLGDMVAFDDPINLDNNLHSIPVRPAQGFSFYDKRELFTAWLGVSFVYNYTKHTGRSFNFRGANPLMNKANDISVIGGTGDFFKARGTAILMITSFEGQVYFRLRIHFNLFECWYGRLVTNLYVVLVFEL